MRLLKELSQRLAPSLRRGLKTSVADIRKGDWIECDGKVVIVTQLNSTFAGRGARHYLLMVKDAVTETLTTLKPSARDYFEKLDLVDVNHQYLYTVDETAYFLNSKTLEEVALPARLVTGNLAKVLEGGIEVKVRMNVDKPILVHSSARSLKCTVAEVLERREGNPS